MKWFTVFFVFVCFSAKSQENNQEFEHITPFKIKDGLLYFDMIHKDSTMTKADYFEKSMKWLAKAFKDSKEVVEYSDKAAGEIVGRGIVETNSSLGSKDYYKFTINIICKDGRAKIVIDRMIFFSTNPYNKDETPIERYYFKDGDVTKKPRTGFNKSKQKESAAIVDVCTWWHEELSQKSKSHSDF